MANDIFNYELYLYLSFLPKFADANLQWLDLSSVGEFGRGMSNASWWVSEGIKVFKETMAEEIARTDPNATHIVPLSAGLDSRAVLGGLLENVPASRIIAATYGIPGSWDFEVAKDIAVKFGIKHEIFNLLDENWDVDELIIAANRLKSPVSVHQSYVRQKINNHFGSSCVYWSGFMGDVFDYTEIKIPNTDKRKAIEFLLAPLVTKNYKNQKFHNLIIEKMIDECDWERLSQSKIILDLQLQISIQQQQLTRPIVLINGYTFMTPFLNKKWIAFSSSIPNKWAYDRSLHKRIIHDGYADIAKFPTTASAGRSVVASQFEIYLGKAIAKLQPYIMRRDPYFSHPRTNYINWTESLRDKGRLQDSVYSTLQDLKKRGILDERDIDNWWSDHLSRKIDYARLLMNLSSLELLLKAGVMA
jgi:hypothetical protein